MLLTSQDQDLLLADPALRWCLDADKPGFTARARPWLTQTLAFQADEQGQWLGTGSDADRAVGWLSEVDTAADAASPADEAAASVDGVTDDPVSDDADAALTEQERRLDTLLESLTEIAGDEAVERFYAYAEAVDGLQPDLPCHALSSIAVARPEAVAGLIAAALAEVNACPGSFGLFAETADPVLAAALEAAGGEPGGQVWTAELVVRSFWWPAA